MKPAAWSSRQKSLRGFAEVSARRGRDIAGVDAAEDHAEPGREDVGDGAVRHAASFALPRMVRLSSGADIDPELSGLRDRINAVDRELVAALNRRLELCSAYRS